MKKGWEIKKLGNVCSFIAGYTPKNTELSHNGKYPYFKVSDMNRNENSLYMSETDLYVQAPSKIYPANCIVFPKNGGAALTNKKRILKHDSVIDLNTEAILPKDNLLPKYLYLWFLSIDVKPFDKGAALPTLDMKAIGNLEIPIPPLSEQQRIVSILDAAFEKIDALKANVETNLKNAKDLFQQVLKKELEPKDGWKEEKIGNVCSIISGYAFDSKGYSNNINDTLLVCGDNIIHCCFRWETVKRWDKNKYEELKRFALQENDIVLAMDRPWVKSGLKIAKISKNELPSLLIQRTACIRIKSSVSSNYVYYVLQNEAFSKYLIEQQTGVGVPHISGKQIMDYKISFPSLPDQRRIVSVLDSLSEKCKQLEENYSKTMAECDALKQAILKEVMNAED